MVNHSNPEFFSEPPAIRSETKSASFGTSTLKGTSAEMECNDRPLGKSNRLIHKVTCRQSGFVKTCICLCLSYLLLTIPAKAQRSGIDLTFDPATTAVHWTLGAVLHTVHGTFKLQSGSVHLNPNTGEMTGSLVVDATSGESGDSARDQKMHQSVLESAQYRTITFRPTRLIGTFQPNQAQTLTVDGVFNLHGQDHPLQLTVNILPNSNAISVVAHFDVPYVQWGLKDPSTFVLRVSKDVSVDIEATAQIKP
jgi:polyisoprenoid-binding protein YceI